VKNDNNSNNEYSLSYVSMLTFKITADLKSLDGSMTKVALAMVLIY